ncbi:MAG: hypothetical protein H7Y86_05690 [Rhizobacter sp.]|nr:hypothetical protein [Ferruginibacter sp.]
MPNIKSMDATPQRPGGDRLVDAPLTELDLEQFIDDIKDESTWKESDRNSITLHKSPNYVVVLIGLHEKAEMKPHNAEGIMSLQVLKGTIDFIVETKKIEMKKGNMIVLHENIFHSICAQEDSFLLLTIAKTSEEK